MVVESYKTIKWGYHTYDPLMNSIENDTLLTLFNKVNRKFQDKWFTGYEFNDDRSITLRIEYLTEPKSLYIGNYALTRALYNELRT